jgi:glutamine amidotransferase
VRAPLFVAHVRAATGTPTQETNCHPFRFGRWLFVHNGLIRDYPMLRRDLMIAVAPHLFRWIEGSTDSEVMFFLALTFGLERDPRGALEQMAGLIEEVGRRYDVAYPLNMTVCVTDGEQVVAVRYSSESASRSLFHSTSFRQLRALYPDDPRILAAGDDAFLVLSEPLIEVHGVWEEIPEATILMAKRGEIERQRFAPRLPPRKD